MAFSVNEHDFGEVKIQGGFGLGEGMVSSLYDPDEYAFSKRTDGKARFVKLGRKEKRVDPRKEGIGTEVVDVPPAEQRMYA